MTSCTSITKTSSSSRAADVQRRVRWSTGENVAAQTSPVLNQSGPTGSSPGRVDFDYRPSYDTYSGATGRSPTASSSSSADQQRHFNKLEQFADNVAREIVKMGDDYNVRTFHRLLERRYTGVPRNDLHLAAHTAISTAKEVATLAQSALMSRADRKTCSRLTAQLQRFALCYLESSPILGDGDVKLTPPPAPATLKKPAAVKKKQPAATSVATAKQCRKEKVPRTKKKGVKNAKESKDTSNIGTSPILAAVDSSNETLQTIENNNDSQQNAYCSKNLAGGTSDENNSSALKITETVSVADGKNTEQQKVDGQKQPGMEKHGTAAVKVNDTATSKHNGAKRSASRSPITTEVRAKRPKTEQNDDVVPMQIDSPDDTTVVVKSEPERNEYEQQQQCSIAAVIKQEPPTTEDVAVAGTSGDVIKVEIEVEPEQKVAKCRIPTSPQPPQIDSLIVVSEEECEDDDGGGGGDRQQNTHSTTSVHRPSSNRGRRDSRDRPTTSKASRSEPSYERSCLSAPQAPSRPQWPGSTASSRLVIHGVAEPADGSTRQSDTRHLLRLLGPSGLCVVRSPADVVETRRIGRDAWPARPGRCRPLFVELRTPELRNMVLSRSSELEFRSHPFFARLRFESYRTRNQ